MDRGHLESQWERYIAGESIGRDERAELLRAFTSDVDLRADFLEDEKIRRTLLAFGRRDDLGFAASFLHRLEVERCKTDFIRQVQARLEGESVLRRTTRRRRRMSGGDRGRGSRAIVFAAGAIVATAAAWMILALPSKGLPRPDRTERLQPEDVVVSAPADRSQGVEVRRPKTDATDSDSRNREETPARTPDAVPETTPGVKPAAEPSTPAPKDPTTPAPRTGGPSRPTITQGVARIERALGASRLDGAGQTPLRTGEELPVGQGIDVDQGGAVTLVYTDRTCLELGPGSLAKEFASQGGKRLSLIKGSLQARVSPQPAGEPLIVLTPHGEATVLGTTLEISVSADPKVGTRLEVVEGKVRFKSRLTGKAVDVEGGRFAVAASGTPLAASLPQYRVVWALDLKNGRMPASVTLGMAAPGPFLPGNPPCLQSAPGSFGPGVNLALDQMVASDPSRMRLRFRYLATGARMCVQVWCPRAEDNFSKDIIPVVSSKWTSVEIPLSEFSRRSDGTRLEKGDLLKHLGMFVVTESRGSVYWDQLELVERVAP
jgi:hypothetical protein